MAKITRTKLIDAVNNTELEIDAVITQTITDSLRVTRFPVESGFSISDHAFKENKRVTLSCTISEATLRERTKDTVIKGITQITGAEASEGGRSVISVLGNVLLNKVPDNIFTQGFLSQETVKVSDIENDPNKISSISSARSFIERVFNSSSLLTLRSTTEETSALIITAVSFEKKSPQKGVLNFTLTLEQIRVVGTGTVLVSQNLKPEISQEGEEEIKSGFNTTIDNPTASSIMLDAVKALAGYSGD
mgnify:CR=1 FL=1